MTNFQKILIVALFYIGWFGCVFFSKWEMSNWSFVFPALLFTVFSKFKPFSIKQFGALLLIAITGAIFDFSASYFDWINFPNEKTTFLPSWLLSMWLLFVGILPLSISLFKERLLWAGLLGAIFGPLSYYSGEAFQVLSFSSQIAIIIYAFFWGLYFPVSIYFYRKLL